MDRVSATLPHIWLVPALCNFAAICYKQHHLSLILVNLDRILLRTFFLVFNLKFSGYFTRVYWKQPVTAAYCSCRLALLASVLSQQFWITGTRRFSGPGAGMLSRSRWAGRGDSWVWLHGPLTWIWIWTRQRWRGWRGHWQKKMRSDKETVTGREALRIKSCGCKSLFLL